MCDRDEKDFFRELLRLLHIHQDVFCSNDDELLDDEDDGKQELELVACFFCGEKFPGNKGIKIHMKKCEEK